MYCTRWPRELPTWDACSFIFGCLIIQRFPQIIDSPSPFHDDPLCVCTRLLGTAAAETQDLANPLPAGNNAAWYSGRADSFGCHECVLCAAPDESCCASMTRPACTAAIAGQREGSRDGTVSFGPEELLRPVRVVGSKLTSRCVWFTRVCEERSVLCPTAA